MTAFFRASTLVIACLGALLCAACSNDTPPPEWGESFERDLQYLADHALEDVGVVPGLGVAVVSGDETLFVGGFGYADLETRRHVGAGTPFYIASATKPITALAFARMDEAGVFDLDRTYANAVPDFEFDPEITADEVILREMLIHTSGVNVDGLTFRLTNTGEWTLEQAWDLLAYSEPSPFAGHGDYGYINAGYNILTTIHEHESGQSWQEMVDEWVFAPIGLNATSGDIDGARAEETLAHGYLVTPLNWNPVRSRFEKQNGMMHSAGGLIMTPSDAARWLRFQLNDGRIDGEQVIDAAIVRESHRALAEIEQPSEASFTREQYGLGWFIGTYEGEPVYYSFGAFTGYFANLSFMPTRDMGVAVFANSNVGSEMTDIISTFAYDWHQDPDAAFATAMRHLRAYKGELSRQRWTARLQGFLEGDRGYQLTLPLSAYEGRYENEEYGTFEVEEIDGALHVRFGPLETVATGFDEEDAVRIELVPQDGKVLWFHVEEGEVIYAALFGRGFLRVE